MKLPIIVFVLFVFLLNSCDDCCEKECCKKPSLEGAWEIVEGEWDFNGEALVFPADTFKDLKSYKFFSKSHWTVIGHVPSDSMHWAHGGKYKLADSVYVEYWEIAKNQEMIGDSAVFEIKLTDEEMKISNKTFKETWKRID